MVMVLGKLRLFLLVILLQLLQITAFMPAFHPPFCLRRIQQISLLGSLEESFENLASEFQGSSVPEIQKILVKKGIDFRQQQDDSCIQKDNNSVRLQSSLEKVPGCVASVFVRTILTERSNDGGNWDVSFEGTADALLSRGLLALLTNALSSSSNVSEILSIDACTVADKLAIRVALSPGRNDGLANMMQIIQGQLKSLLPSNAIHDETIANGQSQVEVNQETPSLFIDETVANRITSDRNGQAAKEVTQVSQNSPSQTDKRASVALLLSGGVDSSVSLRLLLQQGLNVTAFYLKIWLEDELAHLGQCPWEDDYHVCRQVCEQAGVPLETISLQQEYRDRVISYTIHEAQRGRTPNPDILCNSRIKFGCFYDAIAERNFDFVASGHYARLEPNRANISVNKDCSNKSNDQVRLFRAPDPVKDQSYFLCALSQEQLKRVIFPIGHLEKSQVRQLAEDFQLPNRHRADSQGLCFLGKVKFEEFLGAYLGERPGDIVDAATGDIIGRHRGVWFHTVGQRKGIGKVLDPLATSRGPWYVVAKDPDQDKVFCSNQYDEDIFAAARSEFHVEEIQWVAGSPPPTMHANDGKGRFDMKIRHGPRLVPGELTLIDAFGEEGTVKLDRKDGGLAPGQYVVFYDGEECLGGGVISERHWAKFLVQHQASAIATPEA